MSPKAKRRRAESAAAEAGDEDAGEAPAKATGLKQRNWQPVNMDLHMMEAFETGGGVFIEECDDIDVTYGDDLLAEPASGDEDEDNEAGQDVQDDEGQAAETETTQPAKKKRKRKRQAQTQAQAKPKPEPLPLPSTEELAAELPAWEPFGLHPGLLTGLLRLGFRRPTEVQARCLLPAILQRKDIVGAAETGSGKTLAFGLPLLHHSICAEVGDQLQALVVLPTRELAVQVQSHLRAVCREATKIRVECMVGGMSPQKQQRLLGRRPQVVVGTPGRLAALMGLCEEEPCLPFRTGLAGLRHLVLDEADRLVESGHFKELRTILALIYESLARPQQLQTFVFSATLTLDPRSSHFAKGKGGGGNHAQTKAQGGVCSKVDTLMQRMQFRDARAVHLVDLTQGEIGDADGVNRDRDKDRDKDRDRDRDRGRDGDTEDKDKGKGKGKGDQADSATKLGQRLPTQLLFRDFPCTTDKDREAFLVLWLLKRYRWRQPEDTTATTATAAATAAAETPTTTTPTTTTTATTTANSNSNSNSNPNSNSNSSSSSGSQPGGGRTLIFANAINTVMRLSSVLPMVLESPSSAKVLARVQMKMAPLQGHKVEVLGLHSKLKQRDRLQRIEQMRALKDVVMVCTDVAARGLDLPGVSAVIHFHVPRNTDFYVHRSGRTARAGCSGESISIICPSDAAHWVRLQRVLGIGPERIEEVFPTSFEVAAAREATRLATSLETQIHQEKKRHLQKSWIKKAAQEADLPMSEEEEDRDTGKPLAAKKVLKGLYEQMLERVRLPPRELGRVPLPRRGKRWRR